MIAVAPYPDSPDERSRWVQTLRGPKNSVSASRAYAHLVERERTEDGRIAEVATIFLTNRECPWKCVMCDLWRNTTPAPAGSIPIQITRALTELPAGNATVLKLYNSGSFFDEGAIPKSDWKEIAQLCSAFEHVVVECHPKLIDNRVLEFASLTKPTLEIAIGFETVHPETLDKINKRITVRDFERATHYLRSNSIAVRAFLLVGVPFIPSKHQTEWLQRSIQAAFNAGANVVILIPTRAGNGALDQLMTHGAFTEPILSDLEAAQEFGLRLNSGRVFADTWDLARFSNCPLCVESRSFRLQRINLSQKIEPRVECSCAG